MPARQPAWVPQATVFVSSFCIMVLELVAGRIVSRHLGSSLYTDVASETRAAGLLTLSNTLGGAFGSALAGFASLTLVDGLGARVTIRTGTGSQTRHVASGGSYASDSDTRLHFGLANATTIDELVVHWPRGAPDHHENVPGNRRYVLKQGHPPIEVR